MTGQMTEECKTEIVRDRIFYNTCKTTTRFYAEEARDIIRLVRMLDSYRERDEKGRFKKVPVLQ